MMPDGAQHDEIPVRSEKGDYGEGGVREKDTERLGGKLVRQLWKCCEGHQRSTQGTGPDWKIHGFSNPPNLLQVGLVLPGNSDRRTEKLTSPGSRVGEEAEREFLHRDAVIFEDLLGGVGELGAQNAQVFRALVCASQFRDGKFISQVQDYPQRSRCSLELAANPGDKILQFSTILIVIFERFSYPLEPINGND